MGSFSARANQKPGGKAWNIEFRHPLRLDSNRKPGKKVRSALGTQNEAEAQFLTGQMNELLRDETLWTLGARPEAARRFDPRVVHIFFAEIEPRQSSSLAARSEIPLPGKEQGYTKVMLLGAPGAGKSTLVRQLIGSDPIHERFPSTSNSRTTTFPTEVILQSGNFRGLVSFISEHEARFEIEECLAAAIVEAVDGSDEEVARSLLEKSDMRFRLKYLLGDVQHAEDADPYEEDDPTSAAEPDVVVDPIEQQTLREVLADFLLRVRNLADVSRQIVENEHGLIASMIPDDRNAALDLIEQLAIDSDGFTELVADILDQLRAKFGFVTIGDFERTPTGWPRTWSIEKPESERREFFNSITFFGGIDYRSWGKLLTPLVSGMRIAGPLRPRWAETMPRLVVLDTEGLGHKASATADLPDGVLTLLHSADVLLFVDSAKNGMGGYALGKALEAVVNAGQTNKLATAFTHMDMASGPNLKGQAKLDHVSAGIRNVAENQVAHNVSPEAARHLLEVLRGRTFYLGKIDRLEPTPALPELRRLLALLSSEQPEGGAANAVPEYNPEQFSFAIQEAARAFRGQWRGYLGLEQSKDYRPQAWQAIKALSRRYAEGWDDGFVLRPTSNLIASLSAALSRALESPVKWKGNPTPAQQREIIDQLKGEISVRLPALSQRRLREQPQPAWQGAYALRGARSTFTRRLQIENLYEQWVPIPDARGDQSVYAFLDEVKVVIQEVLQAHTERQPQGAQ